MKTICVIAPWLFVLTIVPCAAEPAAWFQAHRGALDERPENTLPAIEHAWGLPGAVPEVDLRTTKDGVIVCIHDTTPARTTDAPATWAGKPIAEIPYDVLATWDAGAWFDPEYAGTRVPTLDAVFDRMGRDDARQLYLDLKAVALDDVITKIRARGFEKRIIFVHGNPVRCAALQRACGGARTMTWLSGPPDRIRARFKWLARRAFHGIDQLQLHLEATAKQPEIRYALEAAELAEAVAKTRAAGVALQVRPFAFDAASLRGLLDMGIRWYVADAPAAFHAALEAAAGMTRKNTQAGAKDE
ncbi:MAG: glycerophosphodiester phosphodiesterase [Candidatus Hydrogenedentota bacterium]